MTERMNGKYPIPAQNPDWTVCSETVPAEPPGPQKAQTVPAAYRRASNGMNAKLAELEALSDILAAYNRSTNFPDSSLLRTTRQAVRRVTNSVYPRMRREFIPLLLKSADLFCNERDFASAIDCWEEVLAVDPDNSYVQRRISSQERESGLSSKEAERIASEYRLQYLGSFGEQVLRGPIAITASDRYDHIYVSDNVEMRIHKFRFSGEYLGTLPNAFRNIRGIFKGSHGTIWVCDFEESRLLEVDCNGAMVSEIRLGEVLGKTLPTPYPLFGCLKDGCIYLLLVNETYRHRILVSFRTADPAGSLRLLETGNIQNPNYIGFHNDDLYVCDREGCDLYLYNQADGRFRRLGSLGIPYPLRWFASSNSGLFLTAGKSVVKILPDGRKIFSADLSALLGVHTTLPLDLAVIEHGTMHLLLVTDYSLGCIHEFSI
ncbi:MAG: hypothetical protein C4576_03570 [Desulfobacteraceae bacterium]|nr:MAG: hypothetical protein C4576_03570 [Desulfobacteraceae bacterium]